MLKVPQATTGAVLIAAFMTTANAQENDPNPFLRFANRADHVELEKSRGALDLQKPFTIELWARWNTDVLDKMMYLAGDEAWPGMSESVPVSAESGWVIRTSKVKDADKQGVEFNVAASARGKRAWLSVSTPPQRVQPGQWQHIAVCRTASELRVYWNGKLAARKAIAGVALHSSPSNVYLGVRKNAWEDREFVGDIRGFRMSSRALYGGNFTPEMPLKKEATTIALPDFALADDSQIPDGSEHDRNGLVVGAKLIKPKK